MNTSKTIKICIEIWQFLKAKWLHIIVFLAINVVIGSLGVWLAVVIAASNDQKSALDELLKSFNSGGPYTFAVAYLAAATAYLVKEYQEKIDTDFRLYKTFFGVVAGLLIIVCSVLAAAQTQTEEVKPQQQIAKTDLFLEKSPPPKETILYKASPIEKYEAVKPADEKPSFKTSHWVQFWLTLFSILIGLFLYFLERAGDVDLKDSLGFIRDNRKKTIKDGQDLMPLIGDASLDDLKL